MDADALLHPVGPHEPGVYWRRRAFVLLGAVLLLVIVVAYGCGGGGARKAASSTPRPTPSATSTPKPSATKPVTVSACAASALSLTLTTDAATYAGSTLPRLAVTVRNTTSTPCTVQVHGAYTWRVVSGRDLVWTNAGCATTSQAIVTTLRPNHPIREAIQWNRHRSTKSCGEGATAAAGTYQARVAAYGVQSNVVVFHLTG